jgi:hypothetical protein
LTKNLCCWLVWSRNLDKNVFISKTAYIRQGFPVKKKWMLTAVFILALLSSAVAATQLVSLGRANPYRYEQEPREVSAPHNVEPPTISSVSPKNNTVFASNNVSFTLNISFVSLPKLSFYYLGLAEVYYKSSWLKGTWQSNATYVDIESFYSNVTTITVNVTDVPEGDHYLEVFAVLRGQRETRGGHAYGHIKYYGSYRVIGYSVVSFTIDSISILSPQNKTYNAADVPLLFKAHESFAQIKYSLDGQDNVTVAGNTTLSDLPAGAHNITIYATDRAGNTGASETIYFCVEKPFPTTLFIAPIASVAIIGSGLLVYFSKRRRG